MTNHYFTKKTHQEKVDSVKKLTTIWSSRGLSIYGRVTIIKSLLIPKLVFISSALSPPSKIIKQVNSGIAERNRYFQTSKSTNLK